MTQTLGQPLGHVGRYELIARLGAGGMGEVFRARAKGAGGFEKQVVIKRILPHLASDPGFVQRFLEEGKLVVKLHHAGIAQILDMGEHEGTYFIAMEHVDGKDLAELLRAAKAHDVPLSVPVAVYVLVELLEALDYAHRATDDGKPLGIIHRDVSPSNVLVSQTGEVKLTDFGIARATERIAVTTTGAIRGKYAYMSPQQAAGADLDPRSDLFSVGVVAWELLSGTRPFDGASDLLTLDRVRFHDPGLLSAIAPHVPEDLSAWVGKMLSKSPDDRFASAEEAVRALRAHMLKSGVMAGRRELAQWASAVVAALPAGLRQKSTTGMSLDDVLRLGLGSNPSSPHTRDVALHTPSAPVKRPALDTPKAVSAPLPVPVPAAAAPLAEPPVTSEAPRSKRPWFMIVLVATNLALIAVVLLVLMRPGTGTNAQPDVVSPDASAVAAADTSETRPEVEAETQVAVVEVVEVSAPEPVIIAGEQTGEALGGLAEAAALADEVPVVVRSTIVGAKVTIDGEPFDRDKPPAFRRGTVLEVRVSAADHVTKTFRIEAGEELAPVRLEKKEPEPGELGSVKFRFFPRTATVMIGSTVIATGGQNDITHSLAPGSYTLVIKDGERVVSHAFSVKPGESKVLGTFDATKEN